MIKILHLHVYYKRNSPDHSRIFFAIAALKKKEDFRTYSTCGSEMLPLPRFGTGLGKQLEQLIP